MLKYFKSNNSSNFKKDAVDYFIKENVFKLFDKNLYRLSKDDLNSYYKSIKPGIGKKIVKKLIDNISVDDVIYIEKTNKSEVVIKKTDSLYFEFDFDVDFLMGKNYNESEYNYLIIDGFIDSVGEIHHLLTEASENKQPYIIFCKGMHEEVKKTIMYNLKRGTINVMPISLLINEENVNILNDIASCHGSDIVSSLKGDTISLAVKRE